MSLVDLSLRRPVTTVMAFVSLVVVGLLAAARLPLEYLPEIDAPFLFIQVPYAGSTPEEVERSIARPAEEVLATLSGIKRINSTSRADAAEIFIEFRWDVDIAIKAVEARDRLEAARAQMPSDVRRFFVFKFSTADQAVLSLRISSGRDLTNSYDLLDRKLKRPLERLPGIARVELQGVQPPEVQIELNADRINAHGIDLASLNARLASSAFSTSGGVISDGDLRYRVQPIGEIESLEAFRNLVIDERGLRLRDVGEVRLRPRKLDYERRLDMRPAVAVEIYKERGANLVPAVPESRFARTAEHGIGEVGGAEAGETDESGLFLGRRRPVFVLDFGGEPNGVEIVAGALLPALGQAAIAFEKEVLAASRDSMFAAVSGDRRYGLGVRLRPGRRRRPLIRGILGSEIAAEGGDAETEAGRKRGFAEEVEGEGIVVGHWEVSLSEGVREPPAEQVRPGDRRRGFGKVSG